MIQVQIYCTGNAIYPYGKLISTTLIFLIFFCFRYSKNSSFIWACVAKTTIVHYTIIMFFFLIFHSKFIIIWYLLIVDHFHSIIIIIFNLFFLIQQAQKYSWIDGFFLACLLDLLLNVFFSCCVCFICIDFYLHFFLLTVGLMNI